MITFVALCFVLSASLLDAASLKSEEGTCPAPEQIKPCYCETKPGYSGSFLMCEGMDNIAEFSKAATALRGKSFVEVIIEDSVIGDMKSDMFSGMKIHSLRLLDSRLTSLGDNNVKPFLGLENTLSSLLINDCFLDTMMTKLDISHLKNLYGVHISGNNIHSIPNDWFENGPTKLSSLYISSNHITSVGDRAFANLKELTRFTLSGNHLHGIQRSMLPDPANKLTDLDIRNNKLTSLPNDLFTNMPSLTNVNIHDNSLTTLSETVFSPVWKQLKEIDARENIIHCDSKMKWIYDTRMPTLFEGTCAHPAKLAGKNLKDLKSTDL